MNGRLGWVLALALACKGGDEKDTPADDTDPVDTENPDPVVDTNGTIVDAQASETDLKTATPGTAVDLIQEESINPASDRDFFAVDLRAGEPYHLWVDSGANLLCDTVMYLYPPGASQPAKVTTGLDGRPVINPGDSIAFNDDMIYRYSGSDPGMVFVPTVDGVYTIQVLEYNDATDPDETAALGGEWCAYKVRGMRRTSIEVEPNGLSNVPTATFPGLAANPFQPVGEEMTGWFSGMQDEDLWRFQFGDLPDPEGGSFWLWSMWPGQPGAPPVRMTLLDSELSVLAQTDTTVPDGHEAFVPDPGILYPVRSNTTYYLQLQPIRASETDTSGLEADAYYVAVAHGYGPDLVRCPGQSDVTWQESEPNHGADSNNLVFCPVGASDMYVATMTGQIAPTGLDTRFVPATVAADTDSGPPEVELRCGALGSCPDREVLTVVTSALFGTQVGGRRITVAVQASTVGSFLTPDVYLFADQERVTPFASSADASYRDPAVTLGAPDAVVQTIIPEDVESVRIMIQPRPQEDATGFHMHPTRAAANTWFLRVLVDQ